MNTPPVHASLFSGIGGFDLAAEWLGFRNAFHCEINPFCEKILKYHFPDAEHYTDISKTDFTPWRGKIDILSGGFPCQPFSVAGQRKVAEDDRYLWPEMLRAIREIQPAWVVGENVAGILTMVQPGEENEMGCSTSLFGESYVDKEIRQQYVVETVCLDLERAGYTVRTFVIPACAVGAPHRRDRVWFVARRVAAHADLNRQRERTHQQIPVTERQETPDDCTCSQDGTASHSDEYRSPSRAACEGTESVRQGQFPLAGERPVGRQRPDGLHGLPRTASDTTEQQGERCEPEQRENGQPWQGELGGSRGEDGSGRIAPHARHAGRMEQHAAAEPSKEGFNTRLCIEELPADRWCDFPTQSPVCSRDDGFPIPMDGITFPKWRQESIKAYGNAIVPQVAYEIFQAIINSYE